MKYKAWRALDNEAISSALLDIAILHVNLALEHSNKNTLPCRKEVIRAEILRLRMESDRILERRV
ncbi:MULTISPECIES: hypothetical protein [unclassified Paenibacillus]|uniref:hypothetical protein n=1 Tax=unclassified Paenibacillus TaxID=185978 RepID=UPI002406D761|nr:MULTISPECIES: hypothetical protein [unclassified Paenibacillus]MDF9843619.1 hypothetical protein [Paenibacillus sp. PastF-2]MDF9850208.1 hypothetical protein [Paenibacillus sp. PastM-2]MDF9856852.1 hypothetical protein [Paenibacillus sp. PastF-1]MDH6482055.1 hypothetical protein [Paenibacillus sp. PastH-2]MDH6509479.1 hypothetical protein [Paenibacillus sp. PastM-3]